MKANWIATLNKIGTVLIDRRFWVFVLGAVAALFGIPELSAGKEAMSTEIGAAVALIIQGITVVVGMVTLILSWQKRPPSGTDYKGSELLERLKEVLKELGVEL